MPSAFKNPFNRRRSSGNVLDIATESPPASSGQSSFRVIERPDRNTLHGADVRPQSQARLSQIRPFNSPLQQLRGKSAEDLGPGTNRGSGGTTNSGSSGYYNSSAASARYSSTSTLPSSIDPERRSAEEELFPPPQQRTTAPMYHASSASAEAPLPPPPSFSSRASRAFSFGLKSKHPVLRSGAPSPSALYDEPAKTPEPEPMKSPARERAMTTSSYASTAVPPKAEARPAFNPTDFNRDFGNDFGDDFGVSMFDSLKNKKNVEENLPPPPPPNVFHRTESEPMYPPRSYSRQGITPSPIQLKQAREDAGSPYSWDGRNSHDGLVSGSAMSSPRQDNGPGLSTIANGIAPAFLSGAKQGYSLVPERNGSPGIELTSPDDSRAESNQKSAGFRNRQMQLDDGDRWSKKYQLHDPQESQVVATSSKPSKSSLRPQAQATAGASRPGALSPTSSEVGSQWAKESLDTTPRAAKSQPRPLSDEPLFDVSPSGPPSRAIRPGSSSHQRTESGTPKKMTKAQFEMLRRYNDSAEHETPIENHSDDEYDDDEDEERAKHMSHQRRKQEANMAVYRQQMKKVTGGGPSDLPPTRPALDRASQSAPGYAGLHLGGMGGTPPADAVRGKQSDDDDDDVPLGILQAHGFPSGARPPTQYTGSVAGSVAGGAGGNLPPFARRLPADPYFGAGLVSPATRESLAFSSAGSVYGGGPATTPMGNPMPTPGAHAGGLVGVIAEEERAKAARRANPNASGYGQQSPLPSNMGMPQMPRTMSMGNIPPPNAYSPSGYPPMPQMPMMPVMGQDPNAGMQMQQFMQMQMQFMQNMMAMQQASMGPGQAPQMPQNPNSFLAPPMSGQRPPSMASQAPGQGRSMTMMQPPSNWGAPMQQQRPSSFVPNGGYAPSMQGVSMSGGPGPGYAPSMAPSERSNVGQPSRYRPVQTGDGSGRSQSMTSSMTLQALQNPQQEDQRKSTIRVVDKPKGAPKVSSRFVEPEEDEDEGWAELAKKRNEKKFKWGRKDKQVKQEPALSELYQDFE